MAEHEYSYQGDDSYCYPGTAVLRNRQNIRIHDDLMVAEREITSLKLLMLREKPMRGQYGFSHLRAIHRFLFIDLYGWAGEIRHGDFLMKGGTVFCRGQYIESMAEDIFGKLAAEHKLRGLGKPAFTQRLAYFMGEVNALHPFREGNGRASREFFRQLSKSAGYDLDFGGVSADRLLQADIAAFDRDYTPLVNLLDEIVMKL